MSEPFDPLTAALRLAGELEVRSVDYAIGGALALSLWSEPRATSDVDLNVFVEPDHLAPVFDAIEASGAAVDRALAEAGLREDAIDRVFLTGGTSLVPAVRRLFTDRFGQGRVDGGGEFVSVAEGLALIGADRLRQAA